MNLVVRMRAALGGSLAGLLVLAACGPVPAAVPTSPPQPAAPKPAAQSGASATQPAAPAALLRLTDAEKQEVAKFYEGKTLRILVGFAAGGGYDLFARTTARLLSQRIPGNPVVVVENQPGAASLIVANNIAQAVPKDGTVIGTFDPALVTVKAVGGGQGQIQFDPKTMGWLGSPTSSTNQCMVRRASGVTTLEELLASPKEITFGATSLGNSTSIQPAVFRMLGAKVKIVDGYSGTNPIALAVEGGELDGMCGTWESIRATQGEWVKGNPSFATVISKSKPDADGELANVPELRQLLKTDEQRRIFDVAINSQTAGFVYAAPPGTPAAQLKALRIALMETWTSAEFKADAEKSKLAVVAQDHQRIQQLFDDILNTPPAILAQAKDVLGIP